jgi:hypothetical protein
MSNTSQLETVFTLTIDAQEIKVHYRPNYISGLAPHASIEFISPQEPRRRIPVSETGYRSYFAPMHEVAATPSIKEYTRMIAQALVTGESDPSFDDDQLPLF